MIVVVSTSLNPSSRSRTLARHAHAALEASAAESSFIDLQERSLPICDGGAVYGLPEVQAIKAELAAAAVVLLASPVYNYDVGSSAKNLLELTTDAWTGKGVGLLLAAGGSASYMSPMGFANSLILDYRCWIVPRFVYAAAPSFSGNQLADPEIETRIVQLTSTAERLAGWVSSEPTDPK